MDERRLKIIGPFAQLLTMQNLELKGPVKDEQLSMLPESGIVIEQGKIKKIGIFQRLLSQFPHASVAEINFPSVGLPGFIDVHTPLSWAGARARRSGAPSGFMSARRWGASWAAHTRMRTPAAWAFPASRWMG